MTKIKNFRITLRAREMARWLKKECGLETTPELEFALEQLIKDSKRWIEPASVYTTLTRPVAEKTTTIPFPEKAVAVSVIAVSIGPAAEQERLAVPESDERGLFLAALQQEALSQTLQFAVRLIQDQAKEEECEMSAPVLAQDAATVASLASLVGVQRIGIDLAAFGEPRQGRAAAAPELPAHARMAWIFWTPVGKGANRAPACRQAGPEKAVA
jgi:hypothetical protein